MRLRVDLPPEYEGRDRLTAQELIDILARKKEKTGCPHPKGTAGRRPDLGNMFFRSKWEANIARYYNFIKVEWEYESKEFEFPIKRGMRFYKSDFYLKATDVYVEVKGWMDKKSQTKLKRMKKYYPDVTINIIGKEEYVAIKKSVGMLIPGWEW